LVAHPHPFYNLYRPDPAPMFNNSLLIVSFILMMLIFANLFATTDRSNPQIEL
jgi:hypothetical protein